MTRCESCRWKSPYTRRGRKGFLCVARMTQWTDGFPAKGDRHKCKEYQREERSK